MGKKVTREDFIERAGKVHGSKYDYSDINYINTSTKVIIKCIKHNFEFKIIPSKHLVGQGCSKCANEIQSNSKKKDLGKLITELKSRRNISHIDFSEAVYISSHDKIKLSCKKHDVHFSKTPIKLLAGRDCPECGEENRLSKRRLSNSSFKKQAEKLHGSLYNYDSVQFLNREDKVDIRCDQHGMFSISVKSHLNGNGCTKCSLERRSNYKRKKLDVFIEEAKQVHGTKFNYEHVIYKNAHTKVIIECPIHGSIQITPCHHLRGQGCKLCSYLKTAFDARYLITTPAKLYYIKIESNGNTYYKIGVTGKDVATRFKEDIKKGVKITILKVWDYNQGNTAYYRENVLLKKFGVHISQDDPLLNGNTEVFDKDVLKLDVNYDR